MLAAAVQLVTLWVSGCDCGIHKKSVLGLAEIDLIFTIAASKILPMALLILLFVITDGFTILLSWASQHIYIPFFCPDSSYVQFLVVKAPDRYSYASSGMLSVWHFFFRGFFCSLLKSLCEWREIWNFNLACADQLVVHIVNWESTKSARVMRLIRAFCCLLNILSREACACGLSHFQYTSLGNVNISWKRSVYAPSPILELWFLWFPD